MKLIKDGNKHYISLDKGENINESLLTVSDNYNIDSGWINGIGAIHDVEIGYFDTDSKGYVKKKFNNHYELLSLSGNVSIKEGNRFIHTHITFSGTDFKVIGGHLFDAKIAAAGEFLIDSSAFKLNRKYNDEIGLHLWCMEGCDE